MNIGVFVSVAGSPVSDFLVPDRNNYVSLGEAFSLYYDYMELQGIHPQMYDPHNLSNTSLGDIHYN
jgi:hypothetical protein